MKFSARIVFSLIFVVFVAITALSGLLFLTRNLLLDGERICAEHEGMLLFENGMFLCNDGTVWLLF